MLHRLMLRRLVLGAALLTAALVVVPAPAEAAARVSVVNDRGGQVVDGTYATKLTVRGSGFQSVRGGHGGVYVWFGTVSGTWQPTKGGASGENYIYVPDSEARDNAGYQRYVAFPGSDTASSANGGTMSAAGAWSVELMVPGAEFEAVGRNGAVRRVDCRKVTCGIITVGAHGVKNSRNETFTPVRVGQVYDAEPTGDAPASPAPSAGSTPAPSAAPSAGSAPATAGGRPVALALEVDRASARAGNALAFTASGLPAGRQVSVVFDDGRAAAGPFLVGSDGGIAGVVLLPVDTAPGTHELRVFGIDEPPVVNFAVAAGVSGGETAAAGASAADDERGGDDESRAAWVFAGASALVLLVVAGQLAWRFRRARRATA